LADQKQVVTHVLPIRHYTLEEQIKVPLAFQAAKLDLLHVPHFNVPLGYRRPFIVTIHDLLWHSRRDPRATTLPAWQYRLKYGAYRFVSQSAMQRAKAILVPTQFVKQEVAVYVDRPDKIVVTSEGMSQTFLDFPSVGSQKRSHKTKERAPYVVYTGSLYPHKNVTVILKALRQVPDLQLKVVTARSIFLDDFWQQARQEGVEKQVEVLSALSDEEVQQLYQTALALVQPSFSEGFGLTGLEAMATGCPVIASDIPVLREVYGDHATFFNPYQAEQLVNVFHQLLSQPPLKADLQAAQKFAQQYRWNKVAAKTWAVYRQACPAL